jgi:hypothetical protein
VVEYEILEDGDNRAMIQKIVKVEKIGIQLIEVKVGAGE